MTREFTPEATAKASRAGKLALMRPVTTSVDGRCVATTRWMPVARAICARRTRLCSVWSGADIIRSASSSISTTMRGKGTPSALRICLRL